jgi:2,3-bisphosphoglycerate-independent phosphoglycerate mutase
VAWLMLDGVGVGAAHGMNPFSMPKARVLGHFGVGIALHETAKATRGSEKPDSSLFKPESKHEIPGLLGQTLITPLIIKAIDARLGIPGLPQSGTGQTSLLTGINAAKLLGYHHGPWPGPTIRPLLEDSLPVRLAAQGGSVRLLNHYPARYLEGIAAGKIRLNAIATAATLAGASLEAKHGERRIPPPLGNPDDLHNTTLEQVREWGREFMRSEATLNIFDSWWSDHLGHEGSPLSDEIPDPGKSDPGKSGPGTPTSPLERAQDHVRRLEAFLEGALEARTADTLLLITSDHGNFEDMGVKTHTFAPVPLVALGPGALEFASVTDLTGIAPALERALEIRGKRNEKREKRKVKART